MKAEIYNALVWLNRPIIRTAIIGIVLLLVTLKVTALELIVVDDPNCYYCNQFRDGAGLIYDQTEHAEWAPLTYVNYAVNYRPIRDLWPDWFRDAMDYGRIGPITGTPTFILYEMVPERGVRMEIGRIVGYGGEEAFYEQMDRYKIAYDEWKLIHQN